MNCAPINTKSISSHQKCNNSNYKRVTRPQKCFLFHERSSLMMVTSPSGEWTLSVLILIEFNIIWQYKCQCQIRLNAKNGREKCLSTRNTMIASFHQKHYKLQPQWYNITLRKCYVIVIKLKGILNEKCEVL